MLAAILAAGCSGPPPGPPSRSHPGRRTSTSSGSTRRAPLTARHARSCGSMRAEQYGSVRGITTRACGWGSLRFDYSVQLIPRKDAAEAVGTRVITGTIEGYRDRADQWPTRPPTRCARP
ncbi:hypothetical protein HBB16_16225 [Pseudonocardia sp. MCCB 268]|nr:hypothetical protein [Pseudonocardia cytotoxica]